MKHSSVGARRLYAALVGPALLCTYPAAKHKPVAQLGNTTSLIRLIEVGAVPAGLALPPAVTA